MRSYWISSIGHRVLLLFVPLDVLGEEWRESAAEHELGRVQQQEGRRIEGQRRRGLEDSLTQQPQQAITINTRLVGQGGLTGV